MGIKSTRRWGHGGRGLQLHTRVERERLDQEPVPPLTLTISNNPNLTLILNLTRNPNLLQGGQPLEGCWEANGDDWRYFFGERDLYVCGRMRDGCRLRSALSKHAMPDPSFPAHHFEPNLLHLCTHKGAVPP